jgi:hypothetical protein
MDMGVTNELDGVDQLRSKEAHDISDGMTSGYVMGRARRSTKPAGGTTGGDRTTPPWNANASTTGRKEGTMEHTARANHASAGQEDRSA